MYIFVQEALHTIKAALEATGLEDYTSEIKILTGMAGLMLALMKAYAYGRDHLLKEIKPFLGADEGFWDRRPKINIADHIKSLRDGLPIISIINFKGGVSKSTTAANLAAFFDNAGLRVLLIDLDYQGSLTDSTADGTAELNFAAHDAIDGKHSAEQVLKNAAAGKSPLARTRILASYYLLNRIENTIVFNWLVKKQKKDVRYNLHHILASTGVRKAFDIVLIDCPPRLMTASVNAICASTHLIVPTILDNLSVSATLNSLSAIQKLREKLSPSLKFLGVLPTFVDQQTGLRRREQEAVEDLKQALSSPANQKAFDGEVPILLEQRILRKAAIAKVAGEEIAFFSDSDVRTMYSKLGAAIATAVGPNFATKVKHADQETPIRDGTNVVAFAG